MVSAQPVVAQELRGVGTMYDAGWSGMTGRRVCLWIIHARGSPRESFGPVAVEPKVL